jgi:hypothetical protein
VLIIVSSLCQGIVICVIKQPVASSSVAVGASLHQPVVEAQTQVSPCLQIDDMRR